MQTKLEVASAEEKDMVFEAILPTALSLMSDLFGNYVVQKFLERGTDEKRIALAKTMRGRVLMLSLDMYGCRLVHMYSCICSHVCHVGDIKTSPARPSWHSICPRVQNYGSLLQLLRWAMSMLGVSLFFRAF
jgi:hypothetical protein